MEVLTMLQQPLSNKHDIAARFFKLVDFQPTSNWNILLLLNTASSLEGGPLNLLKSSTNDPFGIIQAIKKRKTKSRFCEKLTYEGFELFIFVENRKLVSLIIDPHQFLNVFDAKKIAQEMNKIDLGDLGIGWSSKNRAGKEFGWIVWSPKEKEERIQQLIESYKTNNLSLHLLFNTVNELWESHSEINREEFFFDLLPTILILFDIGNIGSLEYAAYLKNDKILTGNELYSVNRFCLHYGDYASKSGNLFRNVGAYKHFKQDSSLFLGLMTESDINARAELIKSSLQKKTRKLLNKRRKPESLGYTPADKGTKRIVKAFYSESVFNELIEKNVIKFRCMKGKITKIIVNIDQLYLYITNDTATEDRILSKSQLPISSYLFFANNIVKSISEMLLSRTAKLSIDDFLCMPLSFFLTCLPRSGPKLRLEAGKDFLLSNDMDIYNDNAAQPQILKDYLKPLAELADFQEFQNRLKNRSEREQKKRKQKKQKSVLSINPALNF